MSGSRGFCATLRSIFCCYSSCSDSDDDTYPPPQDHHIQRTVVPQLSPSISHTSYASLSSPSLVAPAPPVVFIFTSQNQAARGRTASFFETPSVEGIGGYTSEDYDVSGDDSCVDGVVSWLIIIHGAKELLNL